MIFRLGELFCGPGGIVKGATSANINGHIIMIKILVILIFAISALTGKDHFKDGYSYGKSLLI